MKGLKKSVLFLMGLLLLTGCKKEDKISLDVGDLRYSKTYQITSISSEGVFRVGADDMLHFRSESTGEDMIFCYDVNCIHEPASYYNQDPTCRAALFPNAKTRILYYEGYIYYFVSEDVRSHKIYRMKVDGMGRELVAEIPYQESVLTGAVFYEDKLYYLVNERVDNEEGILERHSYILEYNLKTGEYRFVTAEIKSTVFGIDVTKDYVYIMTTGGETGTETYFVRYHKDKLEQEVLISVEECKERFFLAAYDEYYIFGVRDDKVGIHYFESGKETIIIDTKGEKMLPQVSKNGVFYEIVDEDYNTKSYWFYDILSGEITDISEAGFKYGLRDYDGYNGVFISGTIHDTRVIKEEKILGE